MSYAEAIDYLYGLQKYGVKFGLDKTRSILEAVGNPQQSFRCIHVAGTNGKGSISAMTASILATTGHTVGLFTSPHMVSFTERIRVGNVQIPEADVVRLTDEIRDAIARATPRIPDPTFFEFITAMAFLHFKRNGVDRAVLEVGMGGRLDSTNVIMPAVSVISRISYDHKDFLGSTLTAIAGEKAGIIKEGIPVVCASQDDEAFKVISDRAQQMSSTLYLFGRDFGGTLTSSGPEGIVFDYSDQDLLLRDLSVPLAGEHQLFNACLAIRAARVVLGDAPVPGMGGHDEIIRLGLSRVVWPGRLEFVKGDPPMLIDGAHNPDAAQSLAAFVKKYLADRKIILILGIMADKDIPGIMTPLLPLGSAVILTAPNYGRAASPAQLAEHARTLGFPGCLTVETIRESLSRAKKLSSSMAPGGDGIILITGSFFTIGEAKELLGERPILGDLREKL